MENAGPTRSSRRAICWFRQIRQVTRAAMRGAWTMRQEWRPSAGAMAAANLLRRVFVSRPDNVVVMSLKAPAGKLNCALKLDQHPMDGEGYWDGPGKMAMP